VETGREHEILVVTARDDGRERGSSSSVHLSDRVGALGGSLSVEAMSLRVEIPCA